MKVLAGCLVLMLCIFVQAQSPEGALVGTVSDATGARINAATVTVTARDFSLTRKVKTNKSGEFTLESLPPGTYELQVEAPGFAAKTGAVTLAVTSMPSMSIQLQPAAVQQMVNVEGRRDLNAQPI